MQPRRTGSTAALGVLALSWLSLLPACSGTTGQDDSFSPAALDTADSMEGAPAAASDQASVDALNEATAALKEATQALDEATAKANAAVAAANAADGSATEEMAAATPSTNDEMPAVDPGSADPASDPTAPPEDPAAVDPSSQDPSPADEQMANGPTPPDPAQMPAPDPATEPPPDMPSAEMPVVLPDPLLAEALCTTDSYWRGGENDRMRPGEACVSCHAQEREGPAYTIAGTVYATGHEPDDCNGVSGGGPEDVSVLITDANGREIALSPNAAGNFTLRDQIALPYTAKVISAAGERIMVGPQTVGDCNACHTAEGLGGAPGRITLPF